MSFCHCDSCLGNKSHKFPFVGYTLISCGQLDLLYFDVWRPSPLVSINNFKYYVKCMDHFTKYTWLYPISVKSDVIQNFSGNLFQNQT